MERIHISTAEGQKRISQITGMTIKDLAKHLNVDYSNFFKWREGKKPIYGTIQQLAILCKAKIGYEDNLLDGGAR